MKKKMNMRAIDKKTRKARKSERSRRPAKRKPAKKAPKAKGETLIAFLMDATGSMAIRRSESIHGFNSYLGKIKKDKKNKYRLSLRFFSSECETQRFNYQPVAGLPEIGNEYIPSGATPLYDAIAKMIGDVEQSHHTGNVLMVILTDGEENASRDQTLDSVKRMIQEREAKGWNFMYLGSNQDAWVAGGQLGLRHGSTMTYVDSNLGGTYAVAAAATIRNASYTGGQMVNSPRGTLADTKEWQEEAESKGVKPDEVK